MILLVTYNLHSDNNILHLMPYVTENIRKSLDDGNISCRVFVDLQKAFDTVDYQN